MITVKMILFYLFGCITGFSAASLVLSAREEEQLRNKEKTFNWVEEE